MIIGAQLYTVRAYTQNERDFKDTIQCVAQMGYRTVQISGIGSSIRPEKIREICDEAGLKIVLTHDNAGAERILFDTDRLIEEHNILGCDYIGLGGMPEKYRTPEWLYHFALDFKEPAKKISASGKLLMYHNHHFEFGKFCAEGAPDAAPDKRIIEYLMDWFSPEEMGFTLDTYWVQYGGYDPAAEIRRLSGRIPCVHFKDMEILSDGEKRYCPVGSGILDFEGILSALEGTGCNVAFIEQDECFGKDPFVCLQESLAYLKSLGLR